MTVFVQISDENGLHQLAEVLRVNGVDHKLWIEQPENIVTCLATKPYPKQEIQQHFSTLKLFKWWCVVVVDVLQCLCLFIAFLSEVSCYTCGNSIGEPVNFIGSSAPSFWTLFVQGVWFWCLLGFQKSSNVFLPLMVGWQEDVWPRSCYIFSLTILLWELNLGLSWCLSQTMTPIAKLLLVRCLLSAAAHFS